MDHGLKQIIHGAEQLEVLDYRSPELRQGRKVAGEDPPPVLGCPGNSAVG
jgi:hypothetical protein